MMFKFTLFVLLVGLVAAKDCPRRSWPDYRSDNSHGTMSRAFMMQHKQDLQKKLTECRKDPNCYGAGPRERQQVYTPCVDGMAGPYPCNQVDMVAELTFAELCGDDCGVPVVEVTGNDIWGWTDPVSGFEYAVVTMCSGTSFVRLADPENPEVLAFMPGTDYVCNGWRDVKVMNDAAFVGSEYNFHGVQVFDLNRLRDMTGPRVVVQPDTTYTAVGDSHNLVEGARSDTLFVVGATGDHDPPVCRGGRYALNVVDPLNPVYEGSCFGYDDWTHDSQCVVYNGPDTEHVGKEICFDFNEEDLVIADVTDKMNQIPLSRVAYSGNYYTHQGWLTESHATLLLDDELDEYNNHEGSQNQRTLIWDVSDLENPVLVNTYYAPFTAIDHNQYIVGDLTYQANYEAGVRILRIDEPNYSLEEVAFFDTHPDSDNIEFLGAWTAYPFFQSGNIITSTIDTGMFVLRPTIQ